jgi:Mn-dependent DtxR family transcriptional regulator
MPADRLTPALATQYDKHSYGLRDRAACNMEHAPPREIVKRLVQFVEFVERTPHCLDQFHLERVQRDNR